MSSRQVSTLLFLLLALYLLQTAGAQPLPESSQSGATLQFTKPDKMSDERVYGLFFRQVARLNELVNQPSSDPASRAKDYIGQYLQKRLQVTPAGAEEVNRIALQLNDSLAQQDGQARELRTKRHVEVQTRRAQNLPARPSSAELKAIPAQRTALILAARDQLRGSLGNDMFARLDSSLKTQLTKRARAAAASPADVQSNISQDERLAMKNRIAYRAFFHQVMDFKAQADKEHTLGLFKTEEALRTEVQRLAALNDEQAKILDEVATDYSNKLTPNVQKYRELRRQYGQQWLALSVTGKSLSDSKELSNAKDNLKQLRGTIDQITDASIQQLQQKLGEETFSRFDAFVKQPIKRSSLQSSESSASIATPKLEAAR